jgi:hypothetical protein
MSYRIAQDFEYAGKNYWRWSAWIEADGAELDKVKEVAWILHPSFKQDRVIARQRSDNFRLKASGWGTFLLKAEVLLSGGDTLALKHKLRLEYPEASEMTAPTRSGEAAPVRRQPTVYLSYSTQDSRAAARLRAGLETVGLRVLDQTGVQAGEPWRPALQRFMAQSDAVVGLVSEDEISPVVSEEIHAAVTSAKAAVILAAGSLSTKELPKEVHVLQVDMNQLDPTAVAESLRSLDLE